MNQQPTTLKNGMVIGMRWMIRRDMAEVVEIEKGSFESKPWETETFQKHLGKTSVIGMVVEEEKTGKVLGFVVYQLYAKRVHILNLAVDQWLRRLGVGRVMVEKLIAKLSGSHRRSRITVEVEEEWLGAQLLFRECGFGVERVERDGERLKIRMEYRLPKAELDPEEFKPQNRLAHLFAQGE